MGSLTYIHEKPLDAGLTGWAGVEDHLMKNDTGMMKDYADDIDTLLVFVSPKNEHTLQSNKPNIGGFIFRYTHDLCCSNLPAASRG